MILLARPCPVYSLKFAKAEQGKKSVYKTDLRVECDYGYQFPDKAKYKMVTCTASGTWSPSLPPCERKYKAMLYHATCLE